MTCSSKQRELGKIEREALGPVESLKVHAEKMKSHVDDVVRQQVVIDVSKSISALVI